MAGQIYGCYSHRTHATQPCVEDITEGHHKCPWCKAGMVPEWRGWVPLWDRDWCLRYVLINESYFPSVDAIAHRAQVMCSRGKNPISPMVVREETTMVRALPDRAPWSSPVKMLDVCLTLWKCELLVRWYDKHPLVMNEEAEKEPLKSDGKPFSDGMKAAAKKWSGKGDKEPALLDTHEAVNRLKAHVRIEESKNGKHD